ncbi:uncharacterized protein L969DRAFT_19946 [Mixia osmundae IAM 14324]|uniref:Exonuclease domain-containing protein n=1 Tax=Mixia osmundae (strain CBS 9802 / IAM 14324 / JCM 22182 / KY 12970) TaxID=764103 RepID=G7E2M0_MIXOS|nr:uncharacterized protein L969DRAFT_19946 [Mixia osmundae IAM 14324]KEI36946.1 hypothetical protein L969DRAFT_19946 [Mixia osmundae IAM 14324]GAA97080.1 hypothetical protein E5Q_03755 [Mixia osmundae IAM 14324]
MLPTLGLIRIRCPQRDSCSREPCLYSHDIALGATSKPKPKSAASRPSLESKTVPAKPGKAASQAVDVNVAAAVPPPAIPQGSSSDLKERPSKRIRFNDYDLPSHGPPRLISVGRQGTTIPLAQRQHFLRLLHTEYHKLYDQIDQQHRQLYACEDAIDQELTLYQARSPPAVYKSMLIMAVSKVVKRTHPAALLECGTNEEVEQRRIARRKASAVSVPYEAALPLVMKFEDLVSYGYMVEVPDAPHHTERNRRGALRDCSRCKAAFEVRNLGDQSAEERLACRYHPGKLGPMRLVDGLKQRSYTCCSVSDGTSGCTEGPHVFSERDINDLHEIVAFRATEAATKPAPLHILAIDCEMVHSTAGFSLARVSIADGSGRLLLDEFIQPPGDVIDTNFQFSGLTLAQIKAATMTLEQLQDRLLDGMIDVNTIIVGHGLENDLRALRLVHHKVIDTAQLFPHPRGLPLRKRLRDLVRENLQQFIQDDSGAGHDSLEDARSAIRLVRLYLDRAESTTK